MGYFSILVTDLGGTPRPRFRIEIDFFTPKTLFFKPIFFTDFGFADLGGTTPPPPCLQNFSLEKRFVHLGVAPRLPPFRTDFAKTFLPPSLTLSRNYV